MYDEFSVCLCNVLNFFAIKRLKCPLILYIVYET
jgi:hypothetical protein